MIKIKKKEEIEVMALGGKILAHTVKRLLQEVKPGVRERELDEYAEKLILEKGASPGFKKVKGFGHTICISTNDAVVHGIPGSYKLRENDVVGIDCGVFYKGFYTDMSRTLRVKSQISNIKYQKDEVDVFLETGEKALSEAIKAARPGNRVGHISKAIQEIIEKRGYSVVRSLVGHGIGKSLHEEPEVPGFLSGDITRTSLLREGMTLAIEVIYNMGKPGVVYRDDNWTIRTEDGSLSGLFEDTVVITKEGNRTLTE